MKRITAIIILTLTFPLTFHAQAAPQHGGHGGPGFCYSGWILSSHSSLPVGGGCYYNQDTYECTATNQTLYCHQLVCNDGNGTSEVCEPE